MARKSKAQITLTFGQAIAAARLDAGLTQAALAERMGVGRPSLARVETGGRGYAVRENFVKAAAEALGLTISDLLANC